MISAHNIQLLPNMRDGLLGPRAVGPGQRGISALPAQEEARVSLSVSALGKKSASFCQNVTCSGCSSRVTLSRVRG